MLYSILYFALRQYSDAGWLLPAGLRFVALLLAPRRWWPAILLSDCLSSFLYRYENIGAFGAAWYIAASTLPSLSPIIPLLFIKKAWERSFQNNKVELGLLVMAACTTTLISACIGIFTWTLMRSVDKSLPDYSYYYVGFIYSMGDYLGIMMIAPLTIMVSQFRSSGKFKLWLLQSRAWLVGSAITVSSLLFLLVVERATSNTQLQSVAIYLMFVPAVGMTLVYGWRGAVIATTLANLAVQFTSHALRSPQILQAQIICVFMFSILLLLGDAITKHMRNAHYWHAESGRNNDLARRNLRLAEHQIRHSAGLMAKIYDGLAQNTEEWENSRKQSGILNAQEADLRWRVVGGARRNINYIISVLNLNLLDVHGLRIALASGIITEMLNDAGISYSVRVTGDTALLSKDIQVSAYRLTHESIAVLLENPATHIRVRLKVATRGGKQTALVVVRASYKVKYRHSQRKSSPIMSTGLGVDGIESIVSTYNGIMHRAQIRGDTTYISFSLKDPIDMGVAA